MKVINILWKILVAAVFIAYFVTQQRNTHAQVRSWFSANKGKNLHQACFWLKENTNPEDVVLTIWQNGAQVVAHADRPTVVTSKVYPSEVKEQAIRRRDTADYLLGGAEESAAFRIAQKYGIKYVLIEKSKQGKVGSLLNKMLTRQRLDHFKLVFDNGGAYMIYKVI